MTHNTTLNPYRPDVLYPFRDERTQKAVQQAHQADQTFARSGYAKAPTHWRQCLTFAQDSAYHPRTDTPTPEILYAYQLAVRACLESRDDKTARVLIPASMSFAANQTTSS